MITVIQILDDETLFIGKGLLRLLKRHAMFDDVLLILAVIPLEIRRFHDSNVIQRIYAARKKGAFSHMHSFKSDRRDAVAAHPRRAGSLRSAAPRESWEIGRQREFTEGFADLIAAQDGVRKGIEAQIDG